MSANVVFINIDWKSSRMHARLQANMRILAKTIAGVVRAMNPSIICMSEVGETKHPLSEEQMQQVATRSMSAWQDAATEHIQLRSMFTTGSPYMTIYIDGPIQCSDHRILHKLYSAAGEARDAQTFVCTLFDHESVDMVNVHAPSGKHSLQDKQRRELLTNLLQSNSQAKPGSTIGQAHFVMGGDMNTGPHLMSQLLQECRHRGSLRTQTKIHEPTFPKHGDLCIVAGFRARTLTTSAPNHDPRHNPYGICWSVPQSPKFVPVKYYTRYECREGSYVYVFRWIGSNQHLINNNCGVDPIWGLEKPKAMRFFAATGYSFFRFDCHRDAHRLRQQFGGKTMVLCLPLPVKFGSDKYHREVVVHRERRRAFLIRTLLGTRLSIETIKFITIYCLGKQLTSLNYKAWLPRSA